AAVMSMLIIQSTPVSFGAVGTPMIVGVTSGIDNKADVAAAIAPTTPVEYIMQIVHDVALLHALIGVFIPLLLCGLLTRFFGSQRSFSQGLKAWRFSIFACLAFTVPCVIISRLLGASSPSMLGALIGLLIVVAAARKGLSVPKNTFQSPEKAYWERQGLGS